MDTLHFEIGKREDPAAGLVDAVGIFINDHNLVDTVRKVELPKGRTSVSRARRQAPSRQQVCRFATGRDVLPFASFSLLGEPETYYDTDYLDGKLAVLGCGEVGCWPLLVRLSVTEDRVTWGDFEQPHRKSWRYGRLGPFVFERNAYERALRGKPEG